LGNALVVGGGHVHHLLLLIVPFADGTVSVVIDLRLPVIILLMLQLVVFDFDLTVFFGLINTSASISHI